jgi:hypothetical protein
MSETIQENPIVQEGATPWQVLLNSVEQRSRAVADEVMTDAILGDSVTMSVSEYLTQRNKFVILRDAFAEADAVCGNLRKEARELMQSHGYDSEWSQTDISAVDVQFAIRMREATEKAAAINKERAEAHALENQLFSRVLNDIALFASIAVLRQVNQFTCVGESFCVAFITTWALREKVIEDLPITKGMEALSEWLQYAVGVKTTTVELDIYAKNPVAAEIGMSMGIENSGALRLALIDAINNIHTE